MAMRSSMLDLSLMLLAMMLPVLAGPMQYVRARSLANRRNLGIGLFAAGYFVLWTVAGAALSVLAVIIAAVAPDSWPRLLLPLALAALWQSAPGKQRCLNRSHFHPTLSAFGVAGAVDLVRFGLTHAVWCVGSCWALMLIPLIAPPGAELGLMGAVAVWVVAERLEVPTAPRWTLRVPLRALRLAGVPARRVLSGTRLLSG
jgi:predicted metal-binding membrane protein